MYEIYEQLLKEKGLRSADVSRATGIKQSTLTDWKKGRTKSLSAEYIKQIASYLGVSVEYLMTGQVTPSYYLDEDVAGIAQEIHDDPDMKNIFKALIGLPKEDIARFKIIIEGYARGK